MNSPTRDSTQICVPCAIKYDNHDPITECAIEYLKGAIAGIERGKQYNTGFDYKDYMTSGIITAKDRCIEPMMRIMATRKIDQCYDHLAYVALGIAYFLAGCPPSKVELSTNHDFSSKLSGDTDD